MEPRAEVLFEVSFEVCNKVGGIYAVLESKAKKMVELYKENYFLVGPYYPEKAITEYLKQNPPKFCEKIFLDLKEIGINCHFGKWLVQGKPNVILVEFNEILKNINHIKWELWRDYKIDSLGSGFDFDEPVAWATASGIVIEKLLSSFKDKKIIGHFHEWLSGAALLYLHKKIPTVFTTHATMLGRTIAGWGEDLYKEVNEGLKKGITIDPKRPYKYGVQAKHLMEKACVENATTFSTVSEITAKEATYILGRKPDIILPNGLDIERFPTMEEFALLHRKYKEKMKHFFNAYFNPYYETDMWDAMIFFTSGRYEFRNKGYDVLIEALGKLNERMKKEGIKKNVFVLFYVPKDNIKENIELFESIKIYDDIKDKVIDELPWIQEMVLDAIIKGKQPKASTVFRKEFLQECKKKYYSFKKEGDPPFSAYIVDEDDLIVNSFKKNNLLNKKEDKVKVIFYPSYLSTTDRLLGLNYEQATQGSHLGIFPSYYEPWGYTPLECAANGVMTITTDLSGFGIFIQSQTNQKELPGIIVLERENKTHEEVVKRLYEILWTIVNMSRSERVPRKAQAKALASLADWKFLIKNYIQAYNMTLERFEKIIL
ncbi:MAG: glycogen/starch synthase [Candidatus Aenigmatarchaeota archaeon]